MPTDSDLLAMLHARGALALALPYTWDGTRTMLVADALTPAPTDRDDGRPWHDLPGFDGAGPDPWFLAADGGFFCPACVRAELGKGLDSAQHASGSPLRFDGEPDATDVADQGLIIGLQPTTPGHSMFCDHCGIAAR